MLVVNPAKPAGESERGSLVIAMSVLLILANLSILVLARTLVSLRQVRTGQDFSAALASADGGMSDALFQIDQSTPPTINGTGSLGGGTYKYAATQIDAQTYDIKVKGAVGSSAHAIEATASRVEKFPYAVFTNQDLTFNGNGTFNIYSATTLGGVHTNEARVGSNHNIVVNSGKGAGDFQDYFQPSGTCSGCPNGSSKPGPYPAPPATLPTGATQLCATGGVFSGTINGMGGVPYVCDQDVTFSGVVTVTSGPFILYITANHALTMANAEVNSGGAGANVQIYKIGTGVLDTGSGAHATDFTGVLYAPSTDLTVNGDGVFVGALVLNSMRMNGAPNLTVVYDLGLKSIVSQDWKISDWREVPSSSVGL